ncbi:MAG: YdcF family protein [Eggerthellaceae bacterium]|nr:YdcF family protein [Eggerthellaceae bacterium]
MARGKRRSLLGRLIILILVLVGAFVAFSAAVSAYTVFSTRGDVHTIAQVQEEGLHADTIVVLGASVKPDGTPSDILADRLEVAADLYLAGVAESIIVSGDNRSSHYNESDAMKAYCQELGVPPDAIYVDHAGYDTYASMYRAHFVYGADSAFVVTQAYHLYRALAIANGLGMPSYGVPADKGSYDNQAQYSLREVMARDKDFLQTILRIPPEEPTQDISN